MKKGKVRLTIEFPVELPEDLEHPDFFYEEHRCVGDLIEKDLMSIIRTDSEQAVCNVCAWSKVEWLGEIEE